MHLHKQGGIQAQQQSEDAGVEHGGRAAWTACPAEQMPLSK